MVLIALFVVALVVFWRAALVPMERLVELSEDLSGKTASIPTNAHPGNRPPFRSLHADGFVNLGPAYAGVKSRTPLAGFLREPL